jgi:hypothetical protein
MKSKFNESPLNEREIIGYGYLDINICINNIIFISYRYINLFIVLVWSYLSYLVRLYIHIVNYNT